MIFIVGICILIWFIIPKNKQSGLILRVFVITSGIILLQIIFLFFLFIIANLLDSDCNCSNHISLILFPMFYVCERFVPFFGMGGAIFTPILIMNFIFWLIMTGIICKFKKC